MPLEYSYNPCRPFSEGTACTNVAVCQGELYRSDFLFDVIIEMLLVSNDMQLQFVLGTQAKAVWSQGAGLGSTPSISYSEGLKQVQVSLVCSDSTTPEFEVLGESPINTYKFRLTHKCACWDGCAGE